VTIRIIPVDGIGEVQAGDDLVELIESAFVASGDALRSGDVLVVAQKVISKAEGGSELLMDVAHRTGRCGSPPSSTRMLASCSACRMKPVPSCGPSAACSSLGRTVVGRLAEMGSGLPPSEAGPSESREHDGGNSLPRERRSRVMLVLAFASALLLVIFALYVDPYGPVVCNR